ncbi:MAG: NAD(P)H-hydrate dehydratase [Myxococcota bacterium]|nr:NAD(P)H-hydrate dehydratase [Myxococcota bacterium]
MIRLLSPDCLSFRWVLAGDEMARVDQAVIERHGVPGVVLMETAGRHIARAVQTVAPHGRIIIVCGSGNNGGDGFVAARHLQGWRRQVTVYLAAEISQLKGDARVHFEACRLSGVSIKYTADWTPDELRSLGSANIIVDGLLGTGLRGSVREPALGMIQAMNDSQSRVLAIDVPSGVCASTGQLLGVAVAAEWTVSFQASFLGHWHHPGAQRTGELMLADIGMPVSALEPYSHRQVILPDALRCVFEQRASNTHKGTYGHCLVLGGRLGASGAGLMAADAALASGAGLATLGTVPELVPALSRDAYEVMVTPLLAALGEATFVDQILAFDAVILGPGLPKNSLAERSIKDIVTRPSLRGVVDADGLNQLDIALNGIHEDRWVLTPHPGEAARLLGISSKDVQHNRYDAALALARESRSIVVLKGALSLVAAPDGRLAVCPAGNPGMASAGTGDVLAGVIGSLLAQGYAPWDAARFGVLWHGMAGDAARDAKGEASLRARDVIHGLGEVERCYRD